MTNETMTPDTFPVPTTPHGLNPKERSAKVQDLIDETLIRLAVERDTLKEEVATLTADRDGWIESMRSLLVDLEDEANKVLNGQLDGPGFAYLVIDWCADIGLDVPGHPAYRADQQGLRTWPEPTR